MSTPIIGDDPQKGIAISEPNAKPCGGTAIPLPVSDSFLRPIAVLDAPSNLGLRPLEEGTVPGCYKLPWALRDAGLLHVLKAADAGAVTPPKYRSAWTPGEGDRNADAIVAYSIRLADRVGALLNHKFLLVLGGDCSILLGNMLALRRRARYGLVFLDAHSDFRHPDNSGMAAIGAAAGEDLALITGRGDSRLINLEERRPLVRAEDLHLLGIRADDAALRELQELGVAVATSATITPDNAATVAAKALETVTRDTVGFWIHLDLDVVDATEMPAADCPEPNGISFDVLGLILRKLVSTPQCVGMELTIYDPDLDEDGTVARDIVGALRAAFAADERANQPESAYTS